jgi:hypothetical protein
VRKTHHLVPDFHLRPRLRPIWQLFTVEDIQDSPHPIQLLRVIEKQSFIKQPLMRPVTFEVVHTPSKVLLSTDRARSFLCLYGPLISRKAPDVDSDNLRTPEIVHDSECFSQHRFAFYVTRHLCRPGS